MSHDHRPFGQQMAEARRQRLKAQASVASGHPCPYHPAAPFTLPRQDMTTDKELLPCPFCGGPAELFCFPEGPKRAGCANKDATCAGFGMAPVAMWNTRPSSPAPVQGEEIEALAKAEIKNDRAFSLCAKNLSQILDIQGLAPSLRTILDGVNAELTKANNEIQNVLNEYKQLYPEDGATADFNSFQRGRAQ